jgi:hypothetical protein
MQTSQEQINMTSIIEDNSSGSESSNHQDQSHGSSQKIKNLSEIITKAIVKAEKDNDEMLSRIKNARINQIVSTMLQAEKSNDSKIKEMIGTLSEYELNSKIEDLYNLNGLSSEMADQLK